MNVRASCLSVVASASAAVGQVSLQIGFSPAAPQPNSLVHWTLLVHDQSPASHGVAGFSVDLVPADDNTATISLLPSIADGSFASFSRPLGISNPGPGGVGSAFGGTPIVRPSGSTSLLEIGGMQNTFGVPLDSIGLDTQVDVGIGRGPSPVAAAEGDFVAPGSPGLYCIELLRARVNLLVTDAPFGGLWPVTQVIVSTSPSCFTVVPPCDPDYTQDGNVDQADIACLINLVGGDPSCSPNDPDFNHDGNADQADVAALVAVVAGEPCP